MCAGPSVVCVYRARVVCVMLVHARACGASIVRECVRARACGRRRLPSPLGSEGRATARMLGAHLSARAGTVGRRGCGRRCCLLLGRPVVARARKACCPVGRLLVRAKSGMACHSQRQQRLRRPATRTKAIGWHQMSAVCTESATDPYAGQTEAGRAHALMISGRTGRGRAPGNQRVRASGPRRTVC